MEYDIINMKKVKGDIFIIPNNIRRISETTSLILKDKYKRMCNLNHQYDEDMMLQVWMVSEDLATDNMRDHGFTFDGVRYITHLEQIPVSLVRDKHEGDEVEIIYPIHKVFAEDEEKEFANFEHLAIRITAKLSQLDYRYRNFGRFEEVLGSLLAAKE